MEGYPFFLFPFWDGIFFRRLVCCGGTDRSKALQWPVIEQQQHKGECHCHGFGRKSESEEEQHKTVAPPSRFFGVKDIRPEGEHPKEAAEQILPFGNPGHGFHVQRVQGEEGRHKRALP